jgi:hypothetical protein
MWVVLLTSWMWLFVCCRKDGMMIAPIRSRCTLHPELLSCMALQTVAVWVCDFGWWSFGSKWPNLEKVKNKAAAKFIWELIWGVTRIQITCCFVSMVSVFYFFCRWVGWSHKMMPFKLVLLLLLLLPPGNDQSHASNVTILLNHLLKSPIILPCSSPTPTNVGKSEDFWISILPNNVFIAY